MSNETHKTFDLRVHDDQDRRLKYVALLMPILQLTDLEVQLLAYLAPMGSFESKDRVQVMENLNISTSAHLSLILKSLCKKGAMVKIKRGEYRLHSVLLPENMSDLLTVTFRFVTDTKQNGEYHSSGH